MPTIRSKPEVRVHFHIYWMALASSQRRTITSILIRMYHPKRTAPRSVPVYQEKLVKEEIDKMLSSRIIVPVHKATPWIKSFVFLEATKADGTIKIGYA